MVSPDPQVITRATASPGPATGSGRLVSSNGMFGPRSSMAFICAFPGGTPLFDQLVIILVRTDPKPHEISVHFGRKRTVTSTNAGGPVLADCLEMKRWMPRVRLQQRIVLVCVR